MPNLLRSPLAFLMALQFINMLGFAGWVALFNNFGKEAAGFGGYEIGIVQSVREIPGFLAFTAIAWFLIMREQLFGVFSLVLLGFGCLLSGMFPTLGGVLMTTLIMSIGFHYVETANQSLSLQIFPKAQAAHLLGKVASAGAVASMVGYGGMALMWWAGIRDYIVLFAVLGSACMLLALMVYFWFPRIEGTVPQRKTIVLRTRYWLYYALTFMSGARRQIFMAFAGFLLVERFGFKVPDVALLMLATAALTTLCAPVFGRIIGHRSVSAGQS